MQNIEHVVLVWSRKERGSSIHRKIYDACSGQVLTTKVGIAPIGTFSHPEKLMDGTQCPTEM